MIDNPVTSDAFEALKEYMLQNYDAKVVSGGKEIIKRCHFCGDSKNDLSAKHLYIGLKDGLIKYNCFKCPAKGIVNFKFLKDLDCYDVGLINLCEEQNKKNSSSDYRSSNVLRNDLYIKQLIIPNYTNEFGYKKLKYISNRFGHEISINDTIRFKIILNLKDFLDINGVYKYTRHPNTIDILNKYFVGFLSMDNKYVVLRRLVSEDKLPKQVSSRYINYNIYGDENAMKYYAIPTVINTVYPLDIHVAEGAFDILSVYMHVAPIGSNAIYACISGNSYLGLIQFLILRFGFTSFNLHVYLDADADKHYIDSFIESLRVFNINLYLHMNQFSGEKDFGVPMNKIEDSIINKSW